MANKLWFISETAWNRTAKRIIRKTQSLTENTLIRFKNISSPNVSFLTVSFHHFYWPFTGFSTFFCLALEWNQLNTEQQDELILRDKKDRIKKADKKIVSILDELFDVSSGRQACRKHLSTGIFRAMMMILITIPQRKCLHLEITIWSEIMTRRKNQSSHKLSKLKALQPHRDQKDIFEMWNRLVFTSTVVYLRIEFKINSNNVQAVQYTVSDNIIAYARSFTKPMEF